MANTLIEKANDALFKFKSYWKKPPKGYQVSYKEFAAFAVGTGGQSLLGILTGYTTLATSTHLMISYFGMTTSMAWLLGIVASIISLIRSPILSMIIDNSNGKNGKFKPFLMWTTIGSIICYGIIPYIPKAWTEIYLFSVRLPAIPIMGVDEPSTLNFSLAILLAFVLVQIGAFFNTLLCQSTAGIEQTISSVAQERANIGAIRGLVSNLPNSIVNIFLPILAGSVFASRGGWNAVEMYRLIFPICGIGSLLLTGLLIKGVRERTVLNESYVAKVRFSEGVRILSRNKYFWIINIVNLFFGIRGLANITSWITQYSYTSNTAKTVVGLYCTTLLMNAIAVALIISPFLIKKIGKKNTMLFSCIAYTAMIAIQLICHKHPTVVLVVSFFEQLCQGFAFITGIMVSDIMDDIQLKTGKRLEGFWQNYSVIVGTVIGVFTGLLAPVFLAFGGIGFTDDIPTALQNPELRNGAFFYQTLLALIAAVISTIPFFFYDLTEAKHANIVRRLKIRAAAANFKDGRLQDADVLGVREIVDYANEADDSVIKEELRQHGCIGAILEKYDEVKARTEETERAAAQEDFARNAELEAKKLETKLSKAREKAEKNGETFDENKFRKEFIEKSRFLKEDNKINTK